MKKTIYLLAFLFGASVLINNAQDKVSILKADTSIVVAAGLEDEIVDETMSNLFTRIPDSVLFGLQADQKITLTTQSNDSLVTATGNILGGTTVRTAFTADFIALKTSDAGTVQIKLLPLVNDTKMICVVKTVRSANGVSDSRINFYTTQWKPIPKEDLIVSPSVSWFIKEGVDKNSQDWKNSSSLMDVHPMKITLFADNTDLSVRYEIDNYLAKEEYKKIQPFLTEQEKVLHWDKKSYK